MIRKNGFQALISTNTIAQGGTREGSLDVIEKSDGKINFAMRSVRWPGEAAVNVSLVGVHKGEWKNKYSLDGKNVAFISTYLDDAKSLGDPFPLAANQGKSFQGSIVLGKGFILTPEEAENSLKKTRKTRTSYFPI